MVLLACLEHIVDVVQPALACSLLFDSLGESEVAVDPSLEMAFRSDDDIEVFPVLVNEDVAKAAEGLIVLTCVYLDGLSAQRLSTVTKEPSFLKSAQPHAPSML